MRLLSVLVAILFFASSAPALADHHKERASAPPCHDQLKAVGTLADLYNVSFAGPVAQARVLLLEKCAAAHLKFAEEHLMGLDPLRQEEYVVLNGQTFYLHLVLYFTNRWLLLDAQRTGEQPTVINQYMVNVIVHEVMVTLIMKQHFVDVRQERRALEKNLRKAALSDESST